MYHVDNMNQKFKFVVIVQGFQSKAPVNLYNIRLQITDVNQVGIAGAEIVKSNQYTDFFQLFPGIV